MILMLIFSQEYFLLHRLLSKDCLAGCFMPNYERNGEGFYKTSKTQSEFMFAAEAELLHSAAATIFSP